MHLQELGAGSGRSGGRAPGGVSAAISRVMVGTLSLWLRAHEASANAVDTAVSCLDIGGFQGLQAACKTMSSCHWRQLSAAACPHAAHLLDNAGCMLSCIAMQPAADATLSTAITLAADAKLAGHRERPVVVPHALHEYVISCGRWNNHREGDP